MNTATPFNGVLRSETPHEVLFTEASFSASIEKIYNTMGIAHQRERVLYVNHPEDVPAFGWGVSYDVPRWRMMYRRIEEEEVFAKFRIASRFKDEPWKAPTISPP